MAIEVVAEHPVHEVNLTRVFSKQELKDCADLDRECRKQLDDFTGEYFAGVYARAVVAEVWLALKWESLEAWSADVFHGSLRLDKPARELVAGQLAVDGLIS